MFFIDESGSIPKYKDKRYQYRYFVISFIHTENTRKVETTYNHAIRKLKKDFPDTFAALDNPNEMKGSEMPPFMKLYVFEKLFSVTDIRIAYMVVNTVDIEDRFRLIPGRSFNFLVKIIMENFKLSPADSKNLKLKVDNRNTKLEGLTELEGYLFNELVLGSKIIENVNVEYLESKHNSLIQIADIVAHTIYQRFRYKTMPFPTFDDIKEYLDYAYSDTYEYLYKCIRPKIVMPYVYPPSREFIKEVAVTFSSK